MSEDRPYNFLDFETAVEDLLTAAGRFKMDDRRAAMRRIVMGIMDHGVKMASGPQFFQEGSGADGFPPEYLKMIQAQILICAVRELQKPGRPWRLPVKTLDDTGRWVLTMEVEQETRMFKLHAKMRQ